MAKKPTPAPVSKAVAVDVTVIDADRSAANQVALMHVQQESAVRAVALQLGYQLPADCTDPDMIQRDISANMRRSVEACLQVGMGLRVLKAACPHGEFISRLDVLGIEGRVAQKFMQSAQKFGKAALTAHLTKAIGNQTKLFEMLVLDDEQIEELELTGQTGELALDDVATMSVKELRTALRKAKEEKVADDKVSAAKTTKIEKLSRHIRALTPDGKLKELQAEATDIMNDASGAVRGQLRQALLAINDHYDPTGGDSINPNRSIFMAGLVGQIQADLNALREEFNLPDVSSAADQQLASETAQWAGKA